MPLMMTGKLPENQHDDADGDFKHQEVERKASDLQKIGQVESNHKNSNDILLSKRSRFICMSNNSWVNKPT